ncbi:MAG: prephenate dehydrogenase, partial [Actinobacteria bacterium]|nr:prephenate dehydrogenase [Actinomycetota bacterium]
MKLTHVRIVGTGLIGTSIGLALAKRGISVDVDDANEKNAKLARDLIG